jgi:hypothetical protein
MGDSLGLAFVGAAVVSEAGRGTSAVGGGAFGGKGGGRIGGKPGGSIGATGELGCATAVSDFLPGEVALTCVAGLALAGSKGLRESAKEGELPSIAATTIIAYVNFNAPSIVK